MRFYNSWSKKIEEFVPLRTSAVSMYTCGPTVYNDAHIGNLRSFLIADVLRRWIESPLRFSGDMNKLMPYVKGEYFGLLQPPMSVKHVMNLTDIGHMTEDGTGRDKMAVASDRLQSVGKESLGFDPKDPRRIADYYIARFKEDASYLGIGPVVKNELRRASDYIEEMASIIVKLLNRGFAYWSGEPKKSSIYFDTSKFKIGRLSGNIGNTLEGASGRLSNENQSEKRNPEDFLLWKNDPSHIMKWNHQVLGLGYPGWHIECSAMALADGMFSSEMMIDIHTGGEDNIFPHHESEHAQSVCAHSSHPETAQFAKYWLHVRHLFVDGNKMSKSKNNFYTVRDLVNKGFDYASIRLELTKAHYRSNANFTLESLESSSKMVNRWREFAFHSSSMSFHKSKEATLLFIDKFRKAMDEDLNVPAAIASINEWISEVDKPDGFEAVVFDYVDEVLSILQLDTLAPAETENAIYMPGVELNSFLDFRLSLRKEARKNKNWQESDIIRKEIESVFKVIMTDLPDGRVKLTPNRSRMQGIMTKENRQLYSENGNQSILSCAKELPKNRPN